MRKCFLFLAAIGFFLASPLWAKPADIYTPATRLTVLEDTKGGMTSDRKAKLQGIANGAASNPSFFIVSPDKVKVLSRAQFDTREIIADVKTAQFSKEVKRVYQCALVEVLTGPSTGKKGWTVISRDTVGRFHDTYLVPDEAEEAAP